MNGLARGRKKPSALDLDLVLRREAVGFGANLDDDREFRAAMFSFKLLELVRRERPSSPCVLVLRIGFELGAGEKLLRKGARGTGENSWSGDRGSPLEDSSLNTWSLVSCVGCGVCRL